MGWVGGVGDFVLRGKLDGSSTGNKRPKRTRGLGGERTLIYNKVYRRAVTEWEMTK